jgi:long-chain acyl-CoA synthetase
MKTREPWKILDEYRGSAFSGEWPTIPELFDITVLRYPDRPCFTIYEGGRQSLTYAQALAIVKRVAGRLAELKAKPGTNIVLTGKNSPEWAVAYLAILFTGCTVVPLDHQLRKEDIETFIHASGARFLFCDEEKYDSFDENALGLEGKFSLHPDKPGYVYGLSGNFALADAQCRAVDEEDLAAIMYTSGTTGDPKGVMLSHRNLVSDCFLSQANLSIGHTDVFYALLPIHHAYTMLAVFIEALSVGAEIVFAKRLAIAQLLKDFREAGVTMFLGVPMLFNKLLAGIMGKIKEKGALVYGLIRFLMLVSGAVKRLTGINPGKKIFHSVLDAASLSTLRICISGGGPLAPEVFADFNRLGLDFIQGYGLTETSPILTLNPVERYKPASVGKIVARAQMRVLDPDASGHGELAARGPMVMRGYYKNDAATKEVFTEDGWFRTGDIGCIDRENYVYLSGRAKNLIVTEGGKNVYPEEIENAFQLYPEIEQIMVRGYVADAALKSEGIEALILPSKDHFEAKAKALGQASGFNVADIKRRIDEILAEVNARLLSYQRIARKTILDKPLEMTTKRTVKRFQVKGNPA